MAHSAGHTRQRKLPVISPLSAPPQVSADGPVDELIHLEDLLRTQQKRLDERCNTTDSLNNGVSNSAALPFVVPGALSPKGRDKVKNKLPGAPPLHHINGARYNPKPFVESPPSLYGTRRFEDVEVRQLEEDFNTRVNRLRDKMQISVEEHSPSAAVAPPSPLVFSATCDREVIEMATLAFNFAETLKENNQNSPAQDDAKDQRPSLVYDMNNISEQERNVPRILSRDFSGPPDICEHSPLSITMERMSMRSSSIRRATDGARIMMELFANKRDIVLLSPSEVGLARKGDVLSANNILMVDIQDALRSRKGPTGIIAGAPFFRMVPRLNIAGAAQPNISAIRTIVNELRRAFDGDVVWINLREEPLIYINNVSHIVRERKEPFIPMIIPNVTGRSIGMIETKLKEEVLKEARENAGNLSVHMEGRDGFMEDQWECANPDHVLTLQDVFNGLKPQVRYFRIPITRNVGPKPHDFDLIFDICLDDPQSALVFNCQTGRGKTSAMMMVASIVRFYQVCAEDGEVNVRLLLCDQRTFNFRTIKKIVSLIPDGKLHERRLMGLLELSDRVYSMADHISAAFNTGASPEEAMLHLQQYAYFLVFSYYCEQRLWNFHTKRPFSQWLAENNELKVIIARIQSMEEEFEAERIVAPVTEGEEAATVKILRRRHGNVLSSGRILCSLPMEAKDTMTETSGIHALRQLAPDVPIFTCGRLSKVDRRSLLENIYTSFPNTQRLLWLSLRAEPMVFINDVSYTLCDYDTVVYEGEEMGSTMHVSIQAMEQIEERLRRDVLLEAQENKGEILLHRIGENNKRSTIRVKVVSVQTPKAMMTEFAHENSIDYYRVPVPYSGQILATDVDPLLKFICTNTETHNVFIINDSEGSTRTTMALNLLTLYRASKVSDLRRMSSPEQLVDVLRVDYKNIVLQNAQIASQTSVDPRDLPKQPVELQVASTICQMLTAGSLLKVVDAVINLGGCGPRWNILHALNRLMDVIENSPAQKPKLTRNAVCVVRTYLFLLLSAIYIDTMGEYKANLPFSEWVEERTEVAHIIANLDHRAEHTLKYVEARNLMKADVSRRTGDVLTANFALKADHFPGCQKKGIRPDICGAPNFRKVAKTNVYGVAIPTILGIHNILALLGASSEPMRTYPGEHNDKDLFMGFASPRLFDPHFRPEELSKPLRGSVFWVNLREEPILYVGDRPFVFRNLEAPYVNVELTGIAANKVEYVETILVNDVLKEAEEYNGTFLVHDEGNPGELVGIWEVANTETVKTVRTVYKDLEEQGFRVKLVRLPVTDEQSPAVEDFDALVEALLPQITQHMDRRETISFVFNCQMGRGRTTTGMVICCLLIGVVIPEYYDELDNMYKPLYKEEDSELSRGEYGCIVQLKRVLTGGRKAKHCVDLVLETCAKMQNLRTAIESFALQVKSPDVTEAQRGRAHHNGVHYLRRYFNLITFAAYLQEDYNPMHKSMQKTYASWVAQRPELTTLCNSAALK